MVGESSIPFARASWFATLLAFGRTVAATENNAADVLTKPFPFFTD